MTAFAFLNDEKFQDNKDRIQEIYNLLIQHKNYSKKAWKNKNSEIFYFIDNYAKSYEIEWQEFKRIFTDAIEIYNSQKYQDYLNLIQNPNLELCISFCSNLTNRAEVEEKYPRLVPIIEQLTDSRCLSLEERISLLKKGKAKLDTCPYCGSAIHKKDLKDPWDNKTCGKESCRLQAVSDSNKNLSQEARNQKLQKRKETCLKKYGVDDPNRSKAVRNKIEATSLLRYGVRYTTQAASAKEKKKNTFLKKYGVGVASKANPVKEKARKTILEKYGADNIKKSSIIKDIFLEKYGVENSNLIGKNPEKIAIIKSKDRFEEYLRNHDSSTLQQIGDDLGFSPYYIGKKIHEYGFENLVNIKSGNSNEEYSLYQFIKTILPDKEIIFHDRTQIYPYELDIYIPDKKLAVEFNGNFWHSDYFRSNEEAADAKTRHLFKTKSCLEKGIRLIHIFEYEWMNLKKREKIEAFLKDALTSGQTLYARKCTVKEIPFSISKSFFDDNHLQGSVNAKVSFGLFYQNELVACMSFSPPRFSSSYKWEIMRFSCKQGIHIPGAAGKLLNAFREKYKGSIITYSDMSKMTGNVYRALGFIELKPSKPGYVWVKNEEVLGRFSTQKSKLLKEGYKGSSEKEIMEKRGFYRIYDCGNYVFSLS